MQYHKWMPRATPLTCKYTGNNDGYFGRLRMKEQNLKYHIRFVETNYSPVVWYLYKIKSVQMYINYAKS